MKNIKPIQEQLKNKYHKVEEILDLKHMLYRSADIYRSRTAFKLKNEKGEIYKVNYEQFKNDVVFLGTYLIEKGFLNKHIAVIGKNSYNWCVSYMASTIVGVAVPIDKELHHEDIINFMNISESVCILGDNKSLETIIENSNNLNNSDICFIDFDKKEKETSFNTILLEGKAAYLDGNKSFDEIKINPEELKILLFTSGTTGNAKGVCLSHKNICSNILSTSGIVKVKRSDLFFSVLPLHHTYECTLGFLLPIYSGASVSHCEGLRHISKNMQEYHPSVILCVPLLLENLHKKIIKNMNTTLPEKYRKSEGNPFSTLPFIIKSVVRRKVKNTVGGRLRLFIVGAASTNPNILSELEDLNLNSVQGYGLTECSPLVAGNTDFFKRNDAVRTSYSKC